MNATQEPTSRRKSALQVEIQTTDSTKEGGRGVTSWKCANSAHDECPRVIFTRMDGARGSVYITHRTTFCPFCGEKKGE